MKKSAEVRDRAMSHTAHILSVTTLLLLSAVCGSYSYAETVVKDKSLKSYKMPANIKKHIIEKHQKNNDRIDNVMSDLRETSRGPRGHLSLRGNMASYSIKAGSGDPATRVRAIAEAFLKDHVDLFGLPDLNELREERLSTKMGFGGEYYDILFVRYIGELALEGSVIHVEIGPDEAIKWVDVSLVPVPSELYEAANRKTISEDEARRTIEKDARTKNADAKNVKLGDIEIYAIPTAPYAVWKGSVYLGGGRRWDYEVNAFNGEIIERRRLLLGERE